MPAAIKYTIVLLASIFAYSYGSPYTVDVIEVTSNISTPDAVEINLYPVQPTRGVFGLSGYINIKEDIDTDKVQCDLRVLYSSNGISYQLTPFQMSPTSITSLLNGPKRSSIKDLEECCPSADLANPFVSPLTKRFIECENCLYPSDNFPSPLRLGYYDLVMTCQDLPKFDVVFRTLLKLELAM